MLDSTKSFLLNQQLFFEFLLVDCLIDTVRPEDRYRGLFGKTARDTLTKFEQQFDAFQKSWTAGTNELFYRLAFGRMPIQKSSMMHSLKPLQSRLRTVKAIIPFRAPSTLQYP